MKAPGSEPRRRWLRRWYWSLFTGVVLGLLLGWVAVHSTLSDPLWLPLGFFPGRGALALEFTGGEAILLFPLFFLVGFLGAPLLAWPLRQALWKERNWMRAEVRKWQAVNREFQRRIEERLSQKGSSP